MSITSKSKKQIKNVPVKISADHKKRTYNLRQQMPDIEGTPLFNWTFEWLIKQCCLSAIPEETKENNMNRAALYTKIRNSETGIVLITEEEQRVIEEGLRFTRINFPACTIAFDDLFSGKEIKIVSNIKNIVAPDPRGIN